jgi:hypothetical protein
MPMARETLSLIDGRLALTALMKRHANSMCISTHHRLVIFRTSDTEFGISLIMPDPNKYVGTAAHRITRGRNSLIVLL